MVRFKQSSKSRMKTNKVINHLYSGGFWLGTYSALWQIHKHVDSIKGPPNRWWVVISGKADDYFINKSHLNDKKDKNTNGGHNLISRKWIKYIQFDLSIQRSFTNQNALWNIS